MKSLESPIPFVLNKPSTQSPTGKHLLVVDDSKFILKTLSMKLTSSGYRVSTAIDGSAAMGVLWRDPPDLIVLDLSFPPDPTPGGGSWDGFQFMDWLRRQDAGKGIPVIVITGGEPQRFQDRALSAGATDFFHKPIDNNGLLAAIKRALGEEQGDTADSGAGAHQCT